MQPKPSFAVLQKKYRGKYIALAGSSVVAAGTARQVVGRVQRQKLKGVTYMYVPKSKTVIYFL